MQRLTVHLKRVNPILKDGKKIIVNTLQYIVNSKNEALLIISKINETNPTNNVSKWYTSNIK